MITSFKVENFRCFKQAQLDDLRRVNIIVGSNASGKTTLLEAMLVAIGANPKFVVNINQRRGINFVMPANPNREDFELPWAPIFYNNDISKTISFSFVDVDNITKSLKIFFDKNKAVTTIPSSGMAGNTEPSNIIPLNFVRTKGREKSEVLATINQNGVPELQEKYILGPVTGFFGHTQIPGMQETARYFSQLAISGKEDSITKTLQDVFPFINSLHIYSPGNQPAIYLSQHNLSIKLPATLVSAGVHKLLSMIIGIASHQRGIIIIDEIENGFYYKILPEMWSTIWRLSKECNAQIIASTHSNECLQALLPVMKDNDDDFSLIRTISKDDDFKIEQFYGKNLRAALEMRGEVR